eukprot:3091368-Prymnesium_polylepis.1
MRARPRATRRRGPVRAAMRRLHTGRFGPADVPPPAPRGVLAAPAAAQLSLPRVPRAVRRVRRRAAPLGRPSRVVPLRRL